MDKVGKESRKWCEPILPLYTNHSQAVSLKLQVEDTD